MVQLVTDVFGKRSGDVLPGFVDIQVNGGFGHDFTAKPDTIWEVAARLPQYGVTAFVPTVTSAPASTAVAALRVVAAGPPPGWTGAWPIGVHLEGPMISPQRRGTHPLDHLTTPSLETADEILAAGTPRMVTIAPELPGAEQVIRRFRAAGTVVAVGHSNANAAQTEEAFRWGVSHATHLYNAMSGLGHRDPGVAAAVLAHDEVSAGVIADGIHVDPIMLHLAWKLLGSDRIALVTDAMAALGMGDGTYSLGDIAVEVRGIEARNPEGNLAGSAAGMDTVVRGMADATGCSREDLAAMASTTPARIVGHRPDGGDMVLVDEDLRVEATAVAGRVVYERSPS